MNFVLTAFLSFGKKVLAAALTEKFIAFVTFKTAKAVTEKTKNTTDDEIVQELEKAYNGK
ncbi:hypothetical protein [Vibrio parahaemolyticus]|uniref:hypothetical protein n=1 Tax=Vibrio parahaemolyticus TaxID=670 RepID=UPI0005F15709|nr:hypothetical protein [Vibrio parahaemolyticus]KJR15226.1 hypothetical protein UF28_16295 [Vibrio parahaemolyticus]